MSGFSSVGQREGMTGPHMLQQATIRHTDTARSNVILVIEICTIKCPADPTSLYWSLTDNSE